MKDYGKIILAGMLLTAGLYASAQQIPKKLVLVEKWSGTWCYPCTGAARAMEQMDSENRQVALISYQIEKDETQKEKFETEEGISRAEYYGGVDSYPTTRFDGVSIYKGGSMYGNIYPAIFPIYDEALSKMTSFDLSVISLDRENITDFVSKVEVHKVASYDSDKLRLRFAIVEKMVPEMWNGMSELHYVQRDMYPDAAGTEVDFSKGDKQVVEIAGKIDSQWQEKELEIICFLQDDATKEVLQTVSYPFSRTEVQKKGSRTCNFNEVGCFWYMVSAFEDNLEYYKVYSESGEFISEVDKDSNVYTYIAPEPGEVSVRVSAVYENAGETELSPLITGASYRNTLAGAPCNLSFFSNEGKVNEGVLSWEPYIHTEDSSLIYRGFNELDVNPDGSLDTDKKGGALMEDVWVVYSLEASDVYPYRGLNISSISFIPGNVGAGYEVGVFRDGELVLSESVERSVLTEGKWYTHKLAKPFFISGSSSLMIGYKIKKLSEMPINIDKGPVIAAGKTNVIGVSNGEQIKWSELYNGNNIISVCFGLPDEQGDYPVGRTFKGYMVYRNGNAVLSSPQQQCEFFISGENTDGLYIVTSVFEECESVASNAVQVGNISVSEIVDNQVEISVISRSINVSGNCSSLEVYDLSGVMVFRSGNMCGSITTDHLLPGVYVVKVVTYSGGDLVKKIIIR